MGDCVGCSRRQDKKYCKQCWNGQRSDIEKECEIEADKKEAEWKAKLDHIQAKLKLNQSKLAFLCVQFDKDPEDVIRKGDVVVVVQGRSDEAFHAHKMVLATKSTVFSTMFETKMLEGETGVVHVDDATLPVMRAVIKFCYDAEITFTDEVTGEDILVVAHKYLIHLLHKICEEHLIKTLNNDNLPRRLRLAKRFNAPALETAASSFFKSNFDNVIAAVLTELC